MPTQKDRINLSVSVKAVEFIQKAIEMEEDDVFLYIAEQRSKGKGENLSHEEVWS